VRSTIADLGARAQLVSTQSLPIDGLVAFDAARAALRIGEVSIDVDELSGVWVWHADRPRVNGPDPSTARYVRREWELTISALAAVTPRRIWINHPSRANWLEANKLEQLRLAQRVGFRVPQTLLANDPDRILAFAKKFDAVAVKSQGGVWRELQEGTAVAFTQRCTHAELALHRQALRRVPMLVQQYLEKSFELRVTVIDGSAFFCRIDSQASERTRVDWRRYDFENVSHDLITPSPQLLAQVQKLTRASGLRYAAIDLICTPQRQTYFLDLNPMGQFGWIETLTGAPIADSLARGLTNTVAEGGSP
jgi:glutathione synthase/RimK-type ligase-like ATP-grasp enzyme